MNNPRPRLLTLTETIMIMKTGNSIVSQNKIISLHKTKSDIKFYLELLSAQEHRTSNPKIWLQRKFCIKHLPNTKMY